MEDKIQRNEPKRWEMYVRKRRGNGDADPDDGPTPTGGPETGGPASSTQTARSPSQERGNEDHTSGPGTTSTGDPVAEGMTSSTQRTQGPPQERDDPKDDDADYLFGPHGEGKDATLRSMVVRDTSTGSRTIGKTANRPTVQDKSGLVGRICAVDVCEVFSPPRVTAEAARSVSYTHLTLPTILRV